MEQSGDDTLDGGSGNNVMRGGGGSDVFVLQRGRGLSRIRDFKRQDLLTLRGQINPNGITLSTRGNETLISIGIDDLALLEGVRPGGLMIFSTSLEDNESGIKLYKFLCFLQNSILDLARYL